LLGGIFHVAHVVLAGVWLGGLVFTTAVVSPAFGAMKWSEAERVAVRSAVGRQYARVGSVNLVLLALFAVLDGAFGGFEARFYAEYALLPLLFGLAATHGAYTSGDGSPNWLGSSGRRAAKRPEPSPSGAARCRGFPCGFPT
jgi:hypothetical protein